MTKKIYRTWKDNLPLWIFYIFLLGIITSTIIFLFPSIYHLMRTLDWSFFAKRRFLYLRWIFQGLVMTLRISSISMVFALILGTLVGIGRLSHSRIIKAFCTPYVEFFRNTPLLIQLFFWYFGTSALLDAAVELLGLAHGLVPSGVVFLQTNILALKELYNKGQSEFISGVVGLTIYTSAFIAEVVRAGIQAIPHGQTEAARSTGLNKLQILMYVILPQAFRIIIPPLLSQFLALTKNSSQAMVIGVAEVTYMARQVEANTFKGFEAFTVATALYMVISFLMSYLLNRYDRAITIEAMVRKHQELEKTRKKVPGYRLGKLFSLVAVSAGFFVFFKGGQLVFSGTWVAGASLSMVGFIAVSAAMVALMKPEWGKAFIHGALLLGGVILFFDLLGRLDRGLTTFDDPLRQILVPLAWFTLYTIFAGFWWIYFNQREDLFLRKGTA